MHESQEISEATTALGGLRVLDITSGVAGQYCGKLLAAYGANCLLVEPPGGTPTRRLGRIDASQDLSASPLFQHLNQGKTAIALDASSGRGREILGNLATQADVVIRDQDSDVPLELGETTVECVIGEFPAGSAYDGWLGGEMIHQALSGTMYMTGRPDREPLYGMGYRGYYACGTTAYISVLAALQERTTSGRGQRVTATVFESLAAIGQNLVSQYSYSKTYESRRRYPGFLALLECRDAWVVIFAIRNWEAVCRVFGLDELLEDERLIDSRSRLQHWEWVTELLAQRAKALSAEDLVASLQRERVSAEVVTDLGRLVGSEQWKARRMVRVAASADGGGEPALGPPFYVGGTDYNALTASPPLVGGVEPGINTPGINDAASLWMAATPATPLEVPAGALPSHPGPNETPSAPVPAHGPLKSLRVLDFTTAWAGPFAARSLAYLGAHVIKIDAPSHTDSWRGEPRGGAADRYPDGQHGDRPWDRCVLFNTQGQGKWSLGLDLKVAGARRVLLDLARQSDIVIANFTPGVLERLGIGYEDLRSVNPRIIVVEMPAFGPGGPDSHHQGMGKTMEAACGMASLLGYGDGVPALTGPAYLDPIGGLNAVAAALTAVYQRHMTARGCRVTVPQTEAGAHWIGEQILEYLSTGTVWSPQGNAVPGSAPHDAFPCRGEDEWIAIWARGDDEWRAVCDLAGRPDLVRDPRFTTADLRQVHADELRREVSGWTRLHTKQELAVRLQAAGVPAAPVNNGADVAQDSVLHAVGFIKELDHPEAGRHAYPTLSYRLSRTPGGVFEAAPCFGQHNHAILSGLLRYSSQQISELQSAGAVTTEPLGSKA